VPERYKFCVTSKTIPVRLRRPKAEIQARVKPNKVDWNEHFDRPSSGRKFRLTGKAERHER
jgi:hypothetical protein